MLRPSEESDGLYVPAAVSLSSAPLVVSTSQTWGRGLSSLATVIARVSPELESTRSITWALAGVTRPCHWTTGTATMAEVPVTSRADDTSHRRIDLPRSISPHENRHAEAASVRSAVRL